jgi:hypothetical protein
MYNYVKRKKWIAFPNVMGTGLIVLCVDKICSIWDEGRMESCFVQVGNKEYEIGLDMDDVLEALGIEVSE